MEEQCRVSEIEVEPFYSNVESSTVM